MSPAALGPALRQDLRRGATAGVVAAAVFTLVEPVIALAAATGRVRPAAVAAFLALDLTLGACLALALAALGALVFAAPRLALAVAAPARAAAWPGLGAGSEAPRWVPWAWGVWLTVVVYLGSSFTLTLLFERRFKEKLTAAALLAVLQLVVFVVAGLAGFLLGATARELGHRLAPRLGALNPFLRPLPALGTWALLLAWPVAQAMRRVPSLRGLIPWRIVLSLALIAVVMALAARLLARRRLAVPRAVKLVLAGVLVVVVPATLWRIGADGDAKYLVMTASPSLSRVMAGVRWANDFDRDGYGSLFGENDCAPFDKKINPSARDLPDNGVDENCNGRDLSPRGKASWRSAERLPVPPAFQRDWNVLLLTVDTLRYDHTGFGGYKARRGRDTTPRMDELVARSTSFVYAQAPSAGTMASVPAILVSRFFHSGIAVGPERPKQPPLILPENVTLAEVMKEAGYATGAITSHEYFENWGLEQGFDTHDNSIGMPPDPYRVTSHLVTDKAIAWIEGRTGKKWFLWAHYIDPHGRYVAHPGEVEFGKSEEDLYDGEIAYTDKHLGRLLDWLAQRPDADRTIVVITSDHGDGFHEHGFNNHGMALYDELTRVPLIIHVPGLPPRQVEGVVSALDVFPTVADLARADTAGLEIEGESLIPQLFHGRSADKRVVFSETNWPDPLRAVITAEHKLIYNFKANHYQLYALKSDPGEKHNLWGKDQVAGQRMKDLLDEWLDRVFYSRDPGSQAEQRRREKFLLLTPPVPRRALEARIGAARMIGCDLSAEVPAGQELYLTMYFEAVADGGEALSYELELAAGGRTTRMERPFGESLFPTSRWQRGDRVKEPVRMKVPGDWPAGKATVFLRLRGEAGRPVAATGPSALADGRIQIGDLVIRR